MTAIEWGANQMIALYMAVGFVVAVALVYLVMRKTVRTRVRTEREIRDDTDINDWLVVFDWSRKVLYLPTIAASLVACLVMLIWRVSDPAGSADALVPRVVGGIWFAVFFLNFLVEEFEISIKIVVILALCALALGLWLYLAEWFGAFFGFFGRVSIAISAAGYLLVALLGLLAVAVSWIKGLYYYVVFTPNYMNIQWGPTESGDHISREDYNTHVDTEDVLERLMGFGRIVIIFKDQKRPPMTLLVWRIGGRAQLLEKVRGKFAIDLHPQGHGQPAAGSAATLATGTDEPHEEPSGRQDP